MWAYGQHFRIEKNYERIMIFDCGVMAYFDKESCASSRHTNLIKRKLKYVGKIQELYNWIIGHSSV